MGIQREEVDNSRTPNGLLFLLSSANHLSTKSMMTAPPHFRLLLHGQDGSIPYLTPALMRLIFCSPSSSGKDTTSTIDNDGNDLQPIWKWHRDHLILGVAVKDTCVTAIYCDVKSSSINIKKRKNEQQNDSGDDRSAKKVKSEQK